jgi:TolA-binding protein
MAGNYRKAGMTDGARRYLNKIISTYPESEWAAKARRELSGL